ncbi:MAG: ArsR/SmtB family transcription factor [Phycisphaerales bacterium JB039]
MTQVSKQPPASPRHAARRRAPVDRLLDPELFKALADPTRVRLLACLVKCARPCSVSEVAECCSVDFSVVARHLTLLARAGVLAADKQGRTVWYAPRTADLTAHLRQLADALDQCAASGACCAPDSGEACDC